VPYEIGMMVQWAVPIIVSILILGTMSVQQVFAPDEQPQKLTIGGTRYNNDSRNFEIEMSVQFGMVKALQNADFSISVELTITSPDLPPGGVSLTHDFSGDETSPDELGRVKVHFHWDREAPGSSSLFEGNVDVTTEAQILNPAGKPVANSETSRTDTGIVIGDTRTDPGPG